MKNNGNLSKNVAKSSLVLILGGLLCKLIGALYRIPLSNLLGAEGIGLYQIIFPLYSLTLVLVSGGIPLAVSKLTSGSLALKGKKNSSKYFFASFIFCLTFGAFVGFVFFVLAKQLSVLQGTQSAYLSYYLVGGSVFFASLIACFRGLFQGFGNMASTVISQLIEQVVKLVAGLMFAYFLLPYGLGWAVVGAFFALFLSEVFAFAYYIVLTLISARKKVFKVFTVGGGKDLKSSLKKVLKLTFPVTLSQLMVPMAFGVQSLFVVRILTLNGLSDSLAKSYFGILSGMVNSMINFPSVISVSLGIILVPYVSFLLAKKSRNKASEMVKQFYLTIWLIALPCSVGFFVLSQEIISFVFSSGLSAELLPLASLLLKVASLQILFVSFVQVTTVLLQTTGKTWRAFFSLSCFFVVCGGFGLLFAYLWGIIGLAVANLLAYSITCLLNVFLVKNDFETQFKPKEILLPILLSLLMGVIIYILKTFLFLPAIWVLIISVIISMCFYFGFLFAFKVIDFKQLIKLKKRDF